MAFRNTASRPFNYAVALLCVAAALTLRLALDPLLGADQQYLVFILGILAAARLSGREAGIAATVISTPAAWFFFMAPRYSFAVQDARDVGGLLLLLAAGIAISVLVAEAVPEKKHGAEQQTGWPALFPRRAALLGSALILLVGLSSLLYSDCVAERERQHRIAHTYQEVNQIQVMGSDLENAEGDQRSYLLTGDARYLETFHSALAHEESARLSVHQLAGKEAAKEPLLSTVDHLIAERMRLLEMVAGVRQTSGIEAAAAVVRAGEGDRVMLECRKALRALEEDQKRQLAQRSAAAESVALRTRWVLGLGSASLLLLLLMAGVVIERDIAVRDQARNAMRKNEERLRLALDAAHAGIWEWNLDSNENFWSDELWKVYGLQPQSCQPSYEAWQRIMHPDDRECAAKVVNEAARAGAELNVEFRVHAPDGDRWLLSRGRPLRDSSGRARAYIGIAMDISQRKQAEEVLHERERRLRHFTDAAPVAIAMFDTEMRYLAASSRFRSDYSLNGLELAGRSHYEVFPEIPDHWREIHRRCLAGAVERNAGERFRRANGSDLWIRWEIQPWRHAGGEIGGIVLFSEDITEQKKSEQDLMESQERLRLAQQAARIGTFEWLIEPGFLTWTSELEAMHGLEPGTFGGSTEEWRSLVHPEDRDEVRRTLDQFVRTGQLEAEWRVVRADGAVRWLAARGSVFRNEQGDPLRLVGVNIDITELRTAEASAREWQRAFEQAEVAIAMSQPASAKLRAVNAAFARLHGYTTAELANRPIADIFPADARATLQHWIEIANNRGHVTFESEHQRKDGGRLPVRIDLTAMRDETGEVVSRVAFVQDLTSQKRAEQEIRKLNCELEQRVRERTEQLEAANQELETFSYSVSHDLRAPLRGIDGWSQALEEDCISHLDARGREYLGRIRSEAARMGLLIDNMLELSRVSRSALEFAPVDLSAIARKIVTRLQEASPARAIEFVIEPGLEVRGDARFLEFAVTNLLSNAVKFSAPRADARIEFRAFRELDRTAFLVRDNGVGFDMKYASMLFGAFQRLHRSSEFPGTGIGLAIVQRVIRRHGGRVWAQSRPGEGAEFYFTIGDTQ